jgi:hypothetical protein
VFIFAIASPSNARVKLISQTWRRTEATAATWISQFDRLFGSFLGVFGGGLSNPSQIEPGKDVSPVGPTLPAEMLKAPYRPKAALRIAFFFVPVAQLCRRST